MRYCCRVQLEHVTEENDMGEFSQHELTLLQQLQKDSTRVIVHLDGDLEVRGVIVHVGTDFLQLRFDGNWRFVYRRAMRSFRPE